MKKVNFLSQEQRVDGTLFISKNKEKNPGVIFFHGSGSSEKNWLPIAEILQTKGFTTLTFNFRGHANPDTLQNVTAYDGISDGLAAYDFFIKQKKVDPDRIGICGSSFGAVVATHVIEKRKVKSVLLRAPALYKENMMIKKMGKILADENRIFNDMKNIQNTKMMKIISMFEENILIVVSEKDNLIPAQLSKTFFDEAKKAKMKDLQVIKDAPHSIKDPGQRKELVNIITKWFARSL